MAQHWIWYSELKALYPFISDLQLAIAIEHKYIDFDDRMGFGNIFANSNHMESLRYDKYSVVGYFVKQIMIGYPLVAKGQLSESGVKRFKAELKTLLHSVGVSSSHDMNELLGDPVFSDGEANGVLTAVTAPTTGTLPVAVVQNTPPAPVVQTRPAYDPGTASHPAKVAEAARLEIENRKLPKSQRMKREDMAEKVLGKGYRSHGPRQVRKLLEEAREDGFLPHNDNPD